jgi:hypothetical protein
MFIMKGNLMIHRILTIFILSALLMTIGAAQGRGFGLGLEAGTPTGLSAKAWLTHSSALQFGLGFPSLSQTNGTILSIDYLWHVSPFQSHEILRLFYGLGGIIGSGAGDRNFGVRGVGGFAWMPHGSSIDLFAQITPTLYLQSSSHFDVDAAIGVRYFF